MRQHPLNVFLTEPICPDAQSRLADHVHLDIGSENMSHRDVYRAAKSADVILSKTDPLCIDADLMDSAPRLRLIARHGSGYSNVDIEHASRKGIAITNTPGVNAVSTAEFTLCLMLSVARHLPMANVACGKRKTERLAFMGQELQGKTVGIVGVGRIGREVVKRVHALGMHVLAFHPRQSARQLTDLPLELVDLATLLKRSDFVSLHVPLNAETRNLIGAKEIECMKRSAILINLSRGGVVDERALVRALTGRKIQAAATDVLASEPVQEADPLFKLENCLVTPHIAALTKEAQSAVAAAAVDEIIRFSKGEPLQNVINRTALSEHHG